MALSDGKDTVVLIGSDMLIIPPNISQMVRERVGEKTPLTDLMQEAMSVVFSRQTEVRSLDLEHFEETEVFEHIPHPRIQSDV